MKIDRKGFTLIELLAALVILALLMAIAAPNIMSILNNQKNTIYVEDAKKLATVAAYKVRGTTDDSIKKPTNGNCTLMDLSYLDNGDFNDPPQGGAYFSNLSFAAVCNNNGTYLYLVQLMECKNVQSGCNETSCKCSPSGADRGVRVVDVNEFNDEHKKTKDFITDNAYIGIHEYGLPGGFGVSYIYSCDSHGCGQKVGSTNWDANTNNVLYDANDK